MKQKLAWRRHDDHLNGSLNEFNRILLTRVRIHVNIWTYFNFYFRCDISPEPLKNIHPCMTMVMPFQHDSIQRFLLIARLYTWRIFQKYGRGVGNKSDVLEVFQSECQNSRYSREDFGKFIARKVLELGDSLQKKTVLPSCFLQNFIA